MKKTVSIAKTIIILLVILGGTSSLRSDGDTQQQVHGWLSFLNEASLALPTTGHDLDVDETYGINGYLEDADERFDLDHWYGGRHKNRGGRHYPSTGSRVTEKENKDIPAIEIPLPPKPENEPEDLPIYGEELFYRSPSSVSPVGTVQQVVQNSDRILREGDTLRVRIWDNAEIDEERLSVVRLDGTIDLRELGPVVVAGLNVNQAIEEIYTRVTERYLQAQVSVRLEESRGLRIFVAGNAQVPGIHHLIPGATLLTALAECGGPSEIGSYRKISLKRSGEEDLTADLYDILNQGDRTWDVPLRNGDTIWIPKRGPQIRVAGAVKKQAYYELKETTTIGTLMSWAGTRGNTFTDHITLERFEAGNRRVVTTILKKDWENPDLGALIDGDRIEVPVISQLIANPVDLKGNVERPGRYQWYEGMRVMDLVSLGGILLENTDYSRLDIRRRLDSGKQFQFSGASQTTQQESELVTVSLTAAIEGDPEHNLPLRPHDEIVIYNHRVFRPAPTATITGNVFKPGTFELRAGMRVSDLIFEAGGLKEDTNLALAELTRRVYVGFDYEIAYRNKSLNLDLRLILAGEKDDDPLLENYDTVRINKVPQFVVKVSIAGDVKAPGEYVLSKGARISDLIEKAGGYLDTSYPKGARFFRKRLRVIQEESKKRFILEQRSKLGTLLAESLSETEYKSKRYGLITATYEELLRNLERTESQGRIAIKLDRNTHGLTGSTYNLELEEGDRLEIPSIPNEVSIEGHVFNTVSVIHDPRLTLNDYLRQAGGIKSGGNSAEIYVFRTDGTAVLARASGGAGKGRIIRSMFGSRDRHIEPGDIIFVPPVYDMKDDWDFTRGIIDVVFKTAISAGVIASIGS
ncbi:MAG: SLBB domain-containing protein [Verrucomicrobiota bacterium]